MEVHIFLPHNCNEITTPLRPKFSTSKFNYPIDPGEKQSYIQGLSQEGKTLPLVINMRG